MNNQSESLLSQFSNHQLQQLRKAASLEDQEKLIIQFKLENARSQEVQHQLQDMKERLAKLRKPTSRFLDGKAITSLNS